jgi:hypothetical protein
MTELTTLGGLLRLAVQTLRQPRRTFADLRALALPREVLWQALLLVVVISVLLAEAVNLLLAAIVPNGTAGRPLVGPFAFGGIQFAMLILSVLLIDRIGRMMGGVGDLDGAILAVTWLQFIMICLQVVQSAALVIFPFGSALIVLLGIVLFLYLLTAFVAELHGFPSMGRTFAMILFVFMGVALCLSFLLTLSGVTVPR